MPTGKQIWTSWGRTRGPKNLAGENGAAVRVLADTDGLRGIVPVTTQDDPDYSSQGYVTENQRYLHVLVEDLTTADDPVAVTIFGYCHAFQRWFAIPESEAGGEGQNTANADASIDIDNIARLPAAQVPSDREYRRYEIAGIDRVAFVCANEDKLTVFAACSTF